jgi:hypothetical protein
MEMGMPFKSAKQAKFLASQHPSVFRKFVKDSGGKVKISKKNRFTAGLGGK